jgi:probable rRNA maturation factor
VHGLLHLLGYDHADPDEKAEMFSLKDKIIAGWATARPDRASARASGRSGATSGPSGELRP